MNTIKALLFICVPAILLGSGCATTLKHIPSKELNTVKAATPPAKLLVADVGDDRGEVPTRIGVGVSYWFPYRFSARDRGGPLPVSYFVADCMNQDFNHVGYVSSLANKERKPISVDDAISAGKTAGADYLITTKVTDGKTHFWGFIAIPFFEPVWTKIGFDVAIIDMKSVKPNTTFHTFKKDTEWRFAKVTIFDAVFDAAIFGRRWHSRPWSETVVPDALAEAVQRVSKEINSFPVITGIPDNDKKVTVNDTIASQPETPSSSDKNGIPERLEKLKGLKESGVITEEEYQAKRKALVGSL